MLFDSDNLTPETILQAASALTPATTSADVYEVVAAGIDLNEPIPDLLATISLTAKLAIEGPSGLQFVETHVRKLKTFACAEPAERLAMDALQIKFAWGLHLRTAPDGSILAYSGTHWAPLSVQELRSVLTPMSLEHPAPYGPAGKSVGTAVAIIRDLAPTGTGIMIDAPKAVIPVKNGELWILKHGSIEHHMHRPETGSRYVMPVAFDPEAGSPLFDQMLADIFGKADDSKALIDHVLELFGYGIQPVRDIPVIAWLWGDGANGKSSLLKVLQAVVGQTQVWAGTLGALSGDRFMLPNLADKLLFIEDDAKDGERLNDGLLKKISENKVIDTRRVRSTHGMSFHSMIMLLVAMNGAPLLDDISHGMRRRLQVIPFGRIFTTEEMDPTLADRIIATELPGVVNRLLEGLARLRARGKFAPPAECEKAKQALLCAANPLQSFLDERCRSAPGARLRLSELYTTFTAWQRSQGQKVPFPRRGLKARLTSFGFTVRKSEGRMVVDGLALLLEPE